jgi:hypothetical protein
MRRPLPARVRPAFTLLEVLLSSAIALLLVGGLYVALTVELRQASEGRDAVERATIARGVIHRLSTDLSPSITPPGAKLKFKKSSGSGGQGGSGGGGGAQSSSGGSGGSSSSSGASSGSSSSSSSGTGSSSDSSSDATGSQTTNIPLQAGVIGTEDTLTIFVTRYPDPRAGGDSPDSPVPSDLRRISYWLGEKGLCRQEIPWVTGEQFRTQSSYVIEDGKTEDSYLIAPEVTKLSFEYYDISSQTDDGGWASTWDGSQPGPDGTTPMGPPTAIRVKFTIKFKDSSGQETAKDYSHVIALITASGPPTQDDTTNGNGSDSSSGSQGQQGSNSSGGSSPSSGSGGSSSSSGSGGSASSGSSFGGGQTGATGGGTGSGGTKTGGTGSGGTKGGS